MNQILLIFVLCTCVLTNVHAWGRDGHAVIGTLAAGQMDKQALSSLKEILGSTDAKSLGQACNWPDQLRETNAGAVTSPYHYVNIPRRQHRYDRQRDCPAGDCVTERIKGFAAELANTGLDRERRKQAFSWLCHLVGDIHQPLHTGYRDDLGGNNVNIVFQDDRMNLHRYWDSGLIKSRGLSRSELAAVLRPLTGAELSSNWHISAADDWTEESHALVAQYSYPDTNPVSAVFSKQSWKLIQQQLAIAADRLATVVNATIGEGEVLVGAKQR
jgi:hypothetical protein